MIHPVRQTLLSFTCVAFAVSANADTVQWNVNAANTSFPTQNVKGYFDYNTVTTYIQSWNLLAQGFAANNANFIPPPSHVMQPCSGCAGSIGPPYNSAISQEQVYFQDYSNLQVAFFVGLSLPINSSLNGTSSINLLSGAPFSFALAEDYLNLSLGYAPFYFSGTLTYGGLVVGLQGGSQQHPVALVLPSAIGAVNSSIGGAFGTSDFYSFSSTGANTATAYITGATTTDTFTYELFNSSGVLLQIATLSSANNFDSALNIPGAGSYVIGILDTNLDDPSVSISFGSPLVTTASAAPEPTTIALCGCAAVLLGLRRLRHRRGSR